MSREYVLDMVIKIRSFEMLALDLFDQGVLDGTTHTCIGQELSAAYVCKDIDISRDYVFSNHRCHGHFIAVGGDRKALMHEIMGQPTGVCGGIGGSQHLMWKNFFSNGILGGSFPIAAGISSTIKIGRNVVVVFAGDGAFGQGVIYETLNIASLLGLPLLIVVEDNKYAQSTRQQQNLAGTFQARAEAFCIAYTRCSTWDITELEESCAKAIEYVRSSRKPYILHIETYRIAPHSKGDDNRPLTEINYYKERDPIGLLGSELGLDEQLINGRIHESYHSLRSEVVQP